MAVGFFEINETDPRQIWFFVSIGPIASSDQEELDYERSEERPRNVGRMSARGCNTCSQRNMIPITERCVRCLCVNCGFWLSEENALLSERCAQCGRWFCQNCFMEEHSCRVAHCHVTGDRYTIPGENIRVCPSCYHQICLSCRCCHNCLDNPRAFDDRG